MQSGVATVPALWKLVMCSGSVGGRGSWNTNKVPSCGWCDDGCVQRTTDLFFLGKGKEEGEEGPRSSQRRQKWGKHIPSEKHSLCNGMVVRGCIYLGSGVVGTPEAWKEEER